MTQNSHKRSVSFCINELDIGGAEKALVRIAIGLRDRGWSVRVISLRDEGPLAAQLRAAGIEVVALGCGGFVDIRCHWRLKRELLQHPADVLLCFLHQANIYGRLAGRAAGVRRIISGIRVADRRRWVAVTERLTKCCVHHYVAVSRHVGQTHAGLCGIEADRMSHIPNGVDVFSDVSGVPAKADGATILFVGRLCDQKDPMNLLEAYRMLPENVRATVKLQFVGDGPLSGQLARAVRDNGSEHRVTLLGRSDDVEQLMRAATLLVLPSRWEGMPNVVLEAMAVGLPVIAADVDGTREILRHRETGWLVPPRDPSALANAIVEALTRAEDRNHFAQRAQTMVGTDFSWESVIQKYDELLRALFEN